MQNILLKRKILDRIFPWLKKREMVLVIGPRQAGKTSLLYLIRNLLMEQDVSGKNIFYFDLEDFSLLSIMNKGVKEFVRYLELKGASLSEKNFVMIDEIQYLGNPSNFLKLLVDHYPRIKVFASGSSTLEIRKKFKDSLAGRKIVFELLPLDFTEFLIFKGRDALAKRVEEERIKERLLAGELAGLGGLRFHLPELWDLYKEYIIFGGYPRVVLEKKEELKIEYLKEIFNTYVRKDIKDLMQIDDVLAFNDLIKLLALSIGNLLNYNTLTTSLGTARDTLKKYIFLLENTFIIGRLAPYHTNRKKEISKMSRVFFMDTGLRNFVLNDFNSFENRADRGFLLENAVYLGLFKNRSALENVYFWRTIAKQEIDFILQSKSDLIPLEVKTNPAQKNNLDYFMNKYSKSKGVVANPVEFDVRQEGDRKVFFIPVTCF